MNPNAKFLNEAKELENRWAKTGLLEGMDKKYDRQSTAVLLECQRLHNETGTWDCCDECKEREAKELADKLGKDTTVLVIKDTRTLIKSIGKPKKKREPWWLRQMRKQLIGYYSIPSQELPQAAVTLGTKYDKYKLEGR